MVIVGILLSIPITCSLIVWNSSIAIWPISLISNLACDHVRQGIVGDSFVKTKQRQQGAPGERKPTTQFYRLDSKIESGEKKEKESREKEVVLLGSSQGSSWWNLCIF